MSRDTEEVMQDMQMTMYEARSAIVGVNQLLRELLESGHSSTILAPAYCFAASELSALCVILIGRVEELVTEGFPTDDED